MNRDLEPSFERNEPVCNRILARIEPVFPASLYRIIRNIHRIIQYVFPEYPLLLAVMKPNMKRL